VRQVVTEVVEARVSSEGRRLFGVPATARADVTPPSSFSPLLADLHDSLTTYVRQRRADGAPVERVLPEVKGIVREAEFAESWPDELGVLMAQVVRWTIEAYYDVAAPRDLAL
jgi:hypothetical protein